MLVGAAYTANLTSSLVEGSRSSFVLVDIEDAIARDMRICLLGESAQYSYMIEKYPESKSRKCFSSLQFFWLFLFVQDLYITYTLMIISLLN